MRRPLLVIFVFIIMLSYILTSQSNNNLDNQEKEVNIKGVITKKVEKDKYTDYTINKSLIRTYNTNMNLNMGDEVIIKGKTKDLLSMNTDEFNYFNYIKGLGYEELIYLNEYEYVGHNKFFKLLGEIKSDISNKLKYLYKENSHLINSLILGEKDDLRQEDKNMFQRTGTSHVVAISGLHVNIISSILVLFIGCINNKVKLFILMSILITYSMMIGISPSIIRAIFFILISYIGIFIDRKKDLISTLSLIGILLLINNPYIIYNLSFQLSFLATLSIIYFYGYIKKVIKSDIISITLSSNILTFPIIYYNFNNIPINSIISNMIIVPLVGIIICIGLISIFLFNINLGLAKFISEINNIIIDSIYFLLNKIQNIEILYIQIKDPSEVFVMIYYITIFIYMIYKEKKVMKEQENELQGYYKEYKERQI